MARPTEALLVAILITLIAGMAVVSVRLPGEERGAPTPVPSAAPSPTPEFPTDEDLAFLALVEIDPSLCERDAGVHPSDTATAISCNLENDYRIEFWEMEEDAVLDDAYELHRLEAGVEPDSGACQDAGSGEAAIEWNGTVVGRFFCRFLDGRARLEWTDERLRLHARIIAEDVITTDVYRWWLDRFGYLPRTTGGGETTIS